MHAYEAIEQSLTFIEEHLTKEISTEELANTVGLSPFYFQRLFKRLVNKPVQEYVKLRRLAKVIENLKSTDQRILDAALDLSLIHISMHELTRYCKLSSSQIPAGNGSGSFLLA